MNKKNQKFDFLSLGYPNLMYQVSMNENFESEALVNGQSYPLPILNDMKIKGYLEPWKGKGYRLTEKGKAYVERHNKKTSH